MTGRLTPPNQQEIEVAARAICAASGEDLPGRADYGRLAQAALEAVGYGAPLDAVLFCPAPGCGVQHIDAPEPERGWTNPPHKSHLCHACGHIWRPAAYPTNGVATIPPGSSDTLPPVRGRALEG